MSHRASGVAAKHAHTIRTHHAHKHAHLLAHTLMLCWAALRRAVSCGVVMHCPVPPLLHPMHLAHAVPSPMHWRFSGLALNVHWKLSSVLCCM